MNSPDLVKAIRSRLRASADPVRGRSAQAYMKSEMPSLGVRVPDVRALVKACAREFPPGAPDELRSAALELWRSAVAREERYAAIDLTGLKMVSGDPEMLVVFEEMIRTGAWWDLVDGVAPRICELLFARPDIIKPVLLRWSTDNTMWVRRAAITSQLSAKSNTDTELLSAVIIPNAADPEFFIRKAIGWALREYSKTDPGWVRTFATECALSPLSRREALRLMPKA